MTPTLLVVALTLLFSDTLNCEGLSQPKYQCPTDDPDPCTCAQVHGKIILQCSALQSRQQLQQAFGKMAGLGITELSIENSNISHIPRDMFKDSPVTRIMIKKSQMMYLFDRELEHSAGFLTGIIVEDVAFNGGLDWDVLENLVNLQMVVATGSNIESVPYGMYELSLPIETLILENNLIDDIYESAFQNLNSLKILKMKKNFLRSFNRTMLPQPESPLQYLDLSFNQLVSLPEDVFDDLPQLHSVLLAENKLITLPNMDNVFNSLFYLDLAKNPLKCGCNMKWLLTDPKPFHFFGQCSTEEDKIEQKNLKDLTKEDFKRCFA